MREAELNVVSDTGACTIYTIQFLKNADSEFERFYEKFKGRLEYDEDFERLLNVIGRIAEFGALERYFRPEGRMRTIKTPLRDMLAGTSEATQREVAMEFAISNRINDLMATRGLSKSEFAQALGKRPSEITKWLSGQHNFTVRTLSMLSAFFGEPLITVS